MRIGALLIAAVVAFAPGAARAEFAVAALYFSCDADCKAVRARLAEADAKELANLPAQVTETLAVIADAGPPADGQADAVAARLREGPFDGAFDKVRTGTRTCTVYWYGFLDIASQRVGTHQCRLTRKDGRLVVEKRTGDGLHAEIAAYAGPVRAFLGRSFLPGHTEQRYDAGNPANAANDNYGNKVGLALADRGRLYLIDIGERGFTEPDRTFFEVIAIE